MSDSNQNKRDPKLIAWTPNPPIPGTVRKTFHTFKNPIAVCIPCKSVIYKQRILSVLHSDNRIYKLINSFELLLTLRHDFTCKNIIIDLDAFGERIKSCNPPIEILHSLMTRRHTEQNFVIIGQSSLFYKQLYVVSDLT